MPSLSRRKSKDGGTWNTVAGQPTDDSEMALALARLLVARGAYDPEHARAAYQDWLASRPFDCGSTIRAGLLGRPNAESQANDAPMRVSPLGIFGATYPSQLVADWATPELAWFRSAGWQTSANDPQAAYQDRVV